MIESDLGKKEINPDIVLFLVTIISFIASYTWCTYEGLPFLLAFAGALASTMVIFMFAGAFLGYHFG